MMQATIKKKKNKKNIEIGDRQMKQKKNKNKEIQSICSGKDRSKKTVQTQSKPLLSPIALRTAKTPWSFGYSECNRVKSGSF